MEVIKQQRDDVNPTEWHFKIGGIAADGLYRLADLTRTTVNPSTWLAANNVEAQNLIDNGVYHPEFVKRKLAQDARSEAKQWFSSNPATAGLFTLTISELETNLTTHVENLFPLASTADKNKEIKLRMAQLVVLRELVRQAGFI